MKAKFLSSDKESTLANIEVNGTSLRVMNELCCEELEYGIDIEVDLEDSHTEYLTWETLCDSNLEKIRQLNHVKDCSYLAYGKIVSVSPVLCDCNTITIEAPFESEDEDLVGQYISLK